MQEVDEEPVETLPVDEDSQVGPVTEEQAPQVPASPSHRPDEAQRFQQPHVTQVGGLHLHVDAGCLHPVPAAAVQARRGVPAPNGGCKVRSLEVAGDFPGGNEDRGPAHWGSRQRSALEVPRGHGG